MEETNMKKWLMIPVLVCTACGAQEAGAPVVTDAPTQAPTEAPTEVPAQPGQEIIDKLMAAFSPELVEKAKAAGFSVTTDIDAYTYQPYEGFKESERQCHDDVTLISVCIRSATGTTKYGENTVDVDTMKALQCAVIDSGIFDLPAEVADEYKNMYYTPETRYYTESRPANNGIYVELHTNETPFGYEAICYVRHLQRHDVYSTLITYAHRQTTDVTYIWDELRPY